MNSIQLKTSYVRFIITLSLFLPLFGTFVAYKSTNSVYQSGATLSQNQGDSQDLYLPFVIVQESGEQEIPTLEITFPKDGETITLPAEIGYQVTGIQVGEQTGVNLVALVGDPATSFQIEIPLEEQSGIAVLPDDKRLPGMKDLTLRLAKSGDLLPNPEAEVILHDLIIQGRR